MRAFLRNTAIILGLCLVTSGWLVYKVIGPPVPRSLLAKIRPGMAQVQVREILGEPNESHDRYWVYSPPPNAGAVIISFDDQGYVINVNDESAFP